MNKIIISLTLILVYLYFACGLVFAQPDPIISRDNVTLNREVLVTPTVSVLSIYDLAADYDNNYSVKDLKGYTTSDLTIQSGRDLTGYMTRDLTRQSGRDLTGYMTRDLTRQSNNRLSGLPNAQISIHSIIQQMFNLINQERVRSGVAPLTMLKTLMDAAYEKSRDMAENSYFSHGSPTYGNFPGILNHHGIKYTAAAENIGYVQPGPNVILMHRALMSSPGHRANILNAAFQKIGIGIYVRSDGRYYYTQLFIRN